MFSFFREIVLATLSVEAADRIKPLICLDAIARSGKSVICVSSCICRYPQLIHSVTQYSLAMGHSAHFFSHFQVCPKQSFDWALHDLVMIPVITLVLKHLGICTKQATFVQDLQSERFFLPNLKECIKKTESTISVCGLDHVPLFN